MFEGFDRRRIGLDAGEFVARVGGAGPPVLLLHGHPQTHAMWHRIAPLLAAKFTVVCTDLRGYGDAPRPPTDATHAPYSKRAMAADQAQIMAALGFERFALVGHDRGGRVAHRLCLDHAPRVTRVAVLDIAPTLTMYESTDRDFAHAYWHWFFLVLPELPEGLIGKDPEFYMRWMLGRSPGGLATFAPEALAEYLRCAALPGAVHAMCEDYRAAATIDLEHDRGDLGRRIESPMLALWGARNRVWKKLDVLASWRERARDVSGEALPTGHYLAEEAPEATAARLLAFLAG
jgi:haloacetate dehalogenase